MLNLTQVLKLIFPKAADLICEGGSHKVNLAYIQNVQTILAKIPASLQKNHWLATTSSILNPPYILSPADFDLKGLWDVPIC